MNKVNMQREPLTIIGSIASLIGAFIVMMQTFGIPITDAQLDAIQNFVMIASPFVLMIIGRQFVYSPNTVKGIADEQYNAGVPPVEPQPDVPPPADNNPPTDVNPPAVNGAANPGPFHKRQD